MNPILVDMAGALSRTLLALVAGYLVKSGVLAEANADGFVAQLSAGLAALMVAVAWSLWNKYRGRLKLLTAIANPQLVTEAQVEAHVKNPWAENPSITTPKTELPLPAA